MRGWGERRFGRCAPATPVLLPAGHSFREPLNCVARTLRAAAPLQRRARGGWIGAGWPGKRFPRCAGAVGIAGRCAVWVVSCREHLGFSNLWLNRRGEGSRRLSKVWPEGVLIFSSG